MMVGVAVGEVGAAVGEAAGAVGACVVHPFPGPFNFKARDVHIGVARRSERSEDFSTRPMAASIFI